MLHEFFSELSKASPAITSAIAAFSAAIGTVIGAIVTGVAGKLIVTPFLSARDRQDREGEWRKHAIELTKLDLERKIKTRAPTATERIRPSILDFLSNYRDLSELGSKTPSELYETIKSSRISTTNAPKTEGKNLDQFLLLSAFCLILLLLGFFRPRLPRKSSLYEQKRHQRLYYQKHNRNGSY